MERKATEVLFRLRFALSLHDHSEIYLILQETPVTLPSRLYPPPIWSRKHVLSSLRERI